MNIVPMNEKINALNKAKKNLEIASLILAAAGLICILSIFKFHAVGCALFFAVAVFYIFFFRRMVRKYQDQIKVAILEEGFRPFIKDIAYQKKDGLSPAEVSAMQFLPAWHKDRILVRDTIRGTYQAMPVVLTDLTTDFQSSAPGKNGVRKDTVDFLSGCLLDIQLSGDSGADYLLLPKNLFNAPTLKHYLDAKEQAAFEEVAFVGDLAGQFLLYTSPENDKPEIPKEFAKAILRLAEFTPGQTMVQVSGDHLRIFIRNRFLYTYSFLLRTEITSKLLSSNPLPELPYMTRVADALLHP